LIYSIIFGFFLVLSGVLWRYIKYGIPIKATLLMLWQEGIIEGFKEFRTNFIPVTKKVIGEIWKCIKEKFPGIVKSLKPKPVRLNYCTVFLYFSLHGAARCYANKLSPIEISSAYLEQPPHIDVSFYTKSAITEDDEAEIIWALKAKFKEYMRIIYHFDCPCFAVPNVLDNYIEVVLLYWVLPEDYPAFKIRCNQIMQMRAAPAFRPLTEADLPKTSDIVLGYSYEKWVTTGQVVPIPWDIAAAPHIMVSGPTGGGKSIYTKILIYQILEAGASVCLCDYKGQSDYRGLVKDCSIGAECDARLTQFCVDFEKAKELGENGKWRVLIFDEFGSFAASKDKKEWETLMKTISSVVFMGRSYKYSIVLVSQRFDADTIKTSYREQFGVKVFMGPTISQQSATILFPNSEVDKSTRLPPCCGYISTPKTDCDTIIIPKVDIAALDRHLKALGENADEQRD